jgi:hypothetical protein
MENEKSEIDVPAVELKIEWPPSSRKLRAFWNPWAGGPFRRTKIIVKTIIAHEIAFPLIRKVFPSLISNQIASIQPMSLPLNPNPFRRLKVKAKKLAAPSSYFDYIFTPNEERTKLLRGRSEGYSQMVVELNNKNERLAKLSENISRLQAKVGKQ